MSKLEDERKNAYALSGGLGKPGFRIFTDNLIKIKNKIMEDLKVIDVVQLNAGGPKMSILRFIGADKSNFQLK